MIEPMLYGDMPALPRFSALETRTVLNPRRKWWQFWKPRTIEQFVLPLAGGETVKFRRPPRYMGKTQDRYIAELDKPRREQEERAAMLKRVAAESVPLFAREGVASIQITGGVPSANDPMGQRLTAAFKKADGRGWVKQFTGFHEHEIRSALRSMAESDAKDSSK